MIWNIAREEIKFQVSRPIFWITFFALGLIAFFDLNTIGYSKSVLTNIGSYSHDSWLILSRTFTLIIIFSLLVQPLISGFSAFKDYEYGVHLFYLTLPVSKRRLFLGKVIGLLLINCILYSGLLIGSIFGVESLPDNFHSDAYLLPYLTAFAFVTPFFLLLSLLIFSVGIISRSQTTTFLTAIIIIAVLSIINSLVSSRAFLDLPLIQLLDLSGLNFLELELLKIGKNPGVDPGSIYSWKIFERLAVLVLISLSVYLYTSKIFVKNPLRLKRTGESEKKEDDPSEKIVKTSHKFSSNALSHWVQFKVLFLFYFFRIIKNPAFIIITGIIISQVFSNFYKNVANFNLKPTSAYLINFGLDSIKEPIYLLGLFLAGIIIWSEKTKKIDQVLQSYPIPNRIWVLSKFTAVCSSLFLILIILLLFGISIQVYFGYYEIDLPAYLYVVVGQDLITILVCTAAFFLINYLSPNLYVGFGISILAFVLSVAYAGEGFLIHFNYLGYMPRPLFSETNGFGPLKGIVPFFQVLWLFCSLLFLLLCLKTVKNQDDYLTFLKGTLYKFRGLKNLGPVLLTITGTISVAFLIYAKGQRTSQFFPKNLTEVRVLYEKDYSDYSSVLAPEIINTELEINFYPEKDSVDVKGIYHLKNNTKEPIDSMLVNAFMTSEVGKIKIIGGSSYKLGKRDLEAGVVTIYFDKPLLEGQVFPFTFTSFYKNNFPNIYNPNRYIYNEGAYLANYIPFSYNLFPTIGYDKSRLIRGQKLRNEFGLKKNIELFSIAKDSLPKDKATNSWTKFSAVITFPKGYDVITNGRLLENAKKGERWSAAFQTSKDISNEFSLVLGKYRKSSITSDNYQLDFFTRGEVENNEKIIKEAAVNSLNLFDETFGKLRTNNLKVVQIPGYNLIPGTAISKPGIILWDENGGLYYDEQEDFKRIYSTAVHEMSHQWWAHSVKPASYYEGGLTLNESLAQLSRLLALSTRYTKEQVNSFLEQELYKYNYARQSTLEEEKPLYEADQNFVAYEKGSLVMNSLVGYLGEETIKAITKEYFESYKYQNHSFPTTLSFYHILQKKTPDSLNYLIKDSFFEVVNYDLKITGYKMKKSGIDVTIEAYKFNKGKEIEFHNEHFQLGITKKKGERMKWLKLNSGENKIFIQGTGETLSLDPNFLLIDFNHEDNMITVE